MSKLNNIMQQKYLHGFEKVPGAWVVPCCLYYKQNNYSHGVSQKAAKHHSAQ
jgi:hypothetical protein